MPGRLAILANQRQPGNCFQINTSTCLCSVLLAPHSCGQRCRPIASRLWPVNPDRAQFRVGTRGRSHQTAPGSRLSWQYTVAWQAAGCRRGSCCFPGKLDSMHCLARSCSVGAGLPAQQTRPEDGTGHCRNQHTQKIPDTPESRAHFRAVQAIGHGRNRAGQHAGRSTSQA